MSDETTNSDRQIQLAKWCGWEWSTKVPGPAAWYNPKTKKWTHVLRSEGQLALDLTDEINQLRSDLKRVEGERDDLQLLVKGLEGNLKATENEIERIEKERDAIQNQTDDEWLTAFAKSWDEMFGEPYDVLDGETRAEGLLRNRDKLFDKMFELLTERDELAAKAVDTECSGQKGETKKP